MAYKPPPVFTPSEREIFLKVMANIRNQNQLFRFKTRDTVDQRRIMTIKRSDYLDMCSVSLKGNTCRVRFLRHKDLESKNIRGWFDEVKAYTLQTPNGVYDPKDVALVVSDIVGHLMSPDCVARQAGVRIPVVTKSKDLNTTNVYGGLIEAIKVVPCAADTGPVVMVEVKIPQETIVVSKESIKLTYNNLKVGNFFCVNNRGDACAMGIRQVDNYFAL